MDSDEHREEPAFQFRWLGRKSYSEALELQLDLVTKVQASEVGDTILLLEHDPVYTIGRTRDRSSLTDAEQRGLEVFETNRGGQATYHGPGQLVGYPILDLNLYGRDLHQYLRALEEALILGCGEYGIAAKRRDGLTGVWVEDRKIASIGVGVRKWVSMHGFAINVTNDVSGFEAIVPCGIADVEMTSVERESGKSVTVEEFAELMQPLLTSELNRLYITRSG